MSQLLIERETIDREEFEALLEGKDPEEVFKGKPAAKVPSAAEGRRAQKRRPRESSEGGAEGIGRVAPDGAASMTSHGRDRHQSSW
jgi:hypothetical protein